MSEVLGDITVVQRSYFRDDSGRFVSEVEAAATRSALELAEDIADLARIFAPRRSGRLMASIKGYLVSATQGVAVATTPYAAAQEKGAAAHTIGAEGQALANAEENFFTHGPVAHPGNPAVHYLQRAGAAVAALSPSVIRKHFPGV